MSDENKKVVLTDSEWVKKATKTLTTPGILSGDDLEIINGLLLRELGYRLDDVHLAEPGAARTLLQLVVAAVGDGNVASLTAEHQGQRVNPLAIVPRVVPVAPPVVVPPVTNGNGNGHGNGAYVVVKEHPPTNGEGDDARAAALMLEAFRNISRGMTPTAAPMDEEKVREIADASVAQLQADLTAAMELALKEALERIDEAGKGKAHRLEIVHPEGKVINMGDEPRHWQFEQVLTWLTAGAPVWLWGKAGGGKTHMAMQLGKALDLPVTIVPVDPTMTVGKLVGYRNLATGGYVEGFLVKPFRDGGLLMLDEIDTGDPGILAALNALLANGHYMFPCGTTIKRHPMFRVIAGANTKGTGAVAGYTARQRLDAATLNRFAIIELVYDERLEEILVCGDSDLTPKLWARCLPSEPSVARRRWVRWIRKVRQSVGNSVLISPRASYLGADALRAGIATDEVASALVFGLVTEDTKASIISTCGRP